MDDAIDPTMIDNLILSGAVEFRGISEEGNMLYGFTKEAEKIAPEAYNVFVESFYKQIMNLWEKGFLDIDVTKDNPVVMPTQKAFDSDARKLLPENVDKALAFLLDAMKKD